MRPDQLAAYLGRIGLDQAPAADFEGLVAVQRAHRLAIAFENLDIPLGRGIDLAPDALFGKLVERRRGGYCFEQNALFLAALGALGFEARPLLARVWLMAERTPPCTHTLNLVRIGGADHIADAGFGGSYTPPMPLAANAPVATPDGARHRLLEDAEHGWMLERDSGAGWAPQYSFTLGRIWPADLEIGNHWTATRPGSRFTTLRIASRALPDGYASLVDRTLTVSRDNRPQVRQVADAADYRAILAGTFDLELAEAEVEALGLF
ncbi:MAG TPA: arylamine N-acetyltransferase [Allosphingosinicella sp.]|jgi:N-hydroxyarylamine O-acetyltransferase